MVNHRANPPYEAWMAKGDCRSLPNEKFFPNGNAREEIDPAKAICDVCPVKAECLEYAVEYRIVDGIWGGTSEKEREVLIQERRIGRAAINE